MENIQEKQNFTLEDIILQKEKALQRIRDQHELLGELGREVFNPFVPSTEGNSLIKKFNTGMAIFEGVMIGMKVIRSVSRFFKKRY